MSAKRAAQALLELDTNIAAFAMQFEAGGFDSHKRDKVAHFIRTEVMGTWTLTLAAQAAGQTEKAVIGALMELEPLRFGTKGHGRAMASKLFA